MSTRGPGLPVLDEEESLLAGAISTVLNTFSNKQRDFLKQRLQAVKQYKTDIIITALFFHIGSDLSYFTPDKQHSTKRLRVKVTEALDQVNSNMDGSINMNQVSGLNLLSSFVVGIVFVFIRTSFLRRLDSHDILSFRFESTFEYIYLIALQVSDVVFLLLVFSRTSIVRLFVFLLTTFFLPSLNLPIGPGWIK